MMRCATPLKDEERAEEIMAAQEKSFHHVTHDLVREVTSPNSTVRKQAMHSLQVLAQVTGKSVTVIMEPHKEVRFCHGQLGSLCFKSKSRDSVSEGLSCVCSGTFDVQVSVCVHSCL